MGTTLHTLAGPKGATRNRKRIGRGPGSGTGEQSGKGVKGQKARTGHHGARFGFEGGQMPMQRRLPKKGFKNPFRVESFPVNLHDLEERFEPGAVGVDELKAVGLVPRKYNRVKILGEGELTKKLTVKAHSFSAAARTKIEQAGGTVEEIVIPTRRSTKSSSKASAKASAKASEGTTGQPSAKSPA